MRKCDFTKLYCFAREPWQGMIVGIRQKLLTSIFLHELRPMDFYQHFNELTNLIMWKVSPSAVTR